MFVAAPARPARFERALDLTLALLILLFVLPLMAICAVAVRLTSEGPILFRHTRIGLNGEEFTCLKFRTMVVDADAAITSVIQQSGSCNQEWITVRKLKRDPRVTSAGRILRKYCLDELPQLFNVLAGNMSIVGPRPIVTEEIVRYGSAFADYCSVKPGITGLWQVSGRHALSYEQRVQLDSQYARSKSPALDLWILTCTLPIVVSGGNM
ncbi:sugar transferase [Sphingomonas sp. F9_3S_D5_B_2]